MKKLITLVLLVLGACVAAIKLIPQINDLARTHLPDEVLDLIGEEPKNPFERSLDKAKESLNEIRDKAGELFK